VRLSIRLRRVWLQEKALNTSVFVCVQRSLAPYLICLVTEKVLSDNWNREFGSACEAKVLFVFMRKS
jgi:hypothetical protein